MRTTTPPTQGAGTRPAASNQRGAASAPKDSVLAAYGNAVHGILKQNAITLSRLVIAQGDSDGNSYANYAELKAGLQSAGYAADLSEEQFNMLVAQYTDGTNADISADELGKVLERGALIDTGSTARFRFTADNPGAAAQCLLQLATGDGHGYAGYAQLKAGFERSGIRFDVTEAQFHILVAGYTDRVNNDINAGELARAFEEGGLQIDDNGTVSFRLTGTVASAAADVIAQEIAHSEQAGGSTGMTDHAGFMAGLQALGIASGPTVDEFSLLSAQFSARQDGIDAQGLEQAIADGSLIIGNGVASIDYEKIFHAAPDRAMTGAALDILLRCYGNNGRMTADGLSRAMRDGALSLFNGTASLGLSPAVIKDVARSNAEADGSIDPAKLESALRALVLPDGVSGKGRRLGIDPASIAIEYFLVSAAIGSIAALLASKPDSAEPASTTQENTVHAAPPRLFADELHDRLEASGADERRAALLAGFEHAGYRATLNPDQVDVLFAAYGARKKSILTAEQLQRMHDDGALALKGTSLTFRPVKTLHGAIADALKASAGEDGLIQPDELRAGLDKLGLVVFYDNDDDLNALFRQYEGNAGAGGISSEKLNEALQKGDLILDGNFAFTTAREREHARYHRPRVQPGDMARHPGSESNEQPENNPNPDVSDPSQGNSGAQSSNPNRDGAGDPGNAGLQGQGGGDPPRQNNATDPIDGGNYGNAWLLPTDLSVFSNADLIAWYQVRAGQIDWYQPDSPNYGAPLLAELRRRRDSNLLLAILDDVVKHSRLEDFESIMRETADLRILTEQDLSRMMASEHFAYLSPFSFVLVEWRDYAQEDQQLQNWVRQGSHDEHRAEAARRIRARLNADDGDVLDLSGLGLRTMPPIPSLIEESTSHLDLSDNLLTQLELFSSDLASLRIVNNPLTRLRIDSNSLELLNVSDNQLNSLELQTPYLQALNMSHNPLRRVPSNLPRLSELHMLNTHVNSLYGAGYPQLSFLDARESRLRSLGMLDVSQLDYFDFSGNPLPPGELERIGGLLHSAEPEPEEQISLDWLPPDVQALWQQLDVGAEADVFANFLNLLRNSAENIGHQSDFVARIASLLQAMARDPELQSTCFALATEGTATCGDGASKAFYDMELATLVNQAAMHDAGKEEHGISQELFRLGQQLYRQELLDRFIQQDVAQRRETVMRNNPWLGKQYAQNRNELI